MRAACSCQKDSSKFMIKRATKKIKQAQNLARAEFAQQTPIVPPANLSSKALMVVVIIMSFLACLTLGFVTLIQDASKSWQSQIAGEITIQIKPVDGRNMEDDLNLARDIALAFDGMEDATIVNRDDSQELLEPWLGDDFSLEELPIPRLLIVEIDRNNPPDFDNVRANLYAEIPNSYLDDHRTWAARLVNMAQDTVLIGISILCLVLIATTLTVVFATRGAMSVNNDVIEVLHFIGAEASFVAGQFQRHFLMTGFYGGAIGGALAAFVFFLTNLWQRSSGIAGVDDQMTAMFGNFEMGASGYFGIIIIVITLSILIALTTRLTVIKTIKEIDLIRSDPALADRL